MRTGTAWLGGLALAVALAAGGLPLSALAQDAQLKSYDSTRKDFWENPPKDWFLGDETEAQKGQAPPAGPPTGMDRAEIETALQGIKLPQGFKISLWADQVLQARQMAWGDRGTLFVGSFDLGSVYAIREEGGQRTVTTIAEGLNMPTGLAFNGRDLYVVAVNQILRYPNAEDHKDKLPQGEVVYDDFPSYAAHGWKYLTFDREGWLWVPQGVPCNICIPPVGTGTIRRVDPRSGQAELVALGVRNTVGGDIDPRTGEYWFTENARDWLGNDKPSDKLNRISRLGEHFGYPHCHQGDLPDPELAMGRQCSEFSPPVVNLGEHVAPLGMKFYKGDQFPAEYKNNIIVAEHGSWNRSQYQGARLVRVIADADGKNARQEVFAEGWIEGAQTYKGRPADVIETPSGSLLVADDWAGAIYEITYQP